MQLNSGPLITYYSGGQSNERHPEQPDTPPNRVELSRVTVENWVAKTSNLLSDEFGFDPELAGEASAAIELPLHWLHTVWLVSVWKTGAYVTTDESSASIVVTDSDRVETALGRTSRRQVVVGCTLSDGLDPLSTDSHNARPAIPPTAIDYTHDVRMFADSFDSGYEPAPNDVAFESLNGSFTHAQLQQLAAEFLATLEIKTGGRILISELPFKPLDSWPPELVHNPQLATAVIMGTLIANPLNHSHSPTTSLVLCRGLSAEQITQVANQERAILVT